MYIQSGLTTTCKWSNEENNEVSKDNEKGIGTIGSKSQLHCRRLLQGTMLTGNYRKWWLRTETLELEIVEEKQYVYE